MEKTAKFSRVVEDGKVLDIGCGSGALTIAVAKENPKSYVIGLDRWGKEYASFNKKLCENNAKIEGVSARTEFIEGNAVKLPFKDGSFDAIVSNYCIHNIPSGDRQKILLESLRTLKKGGTFALHDIYSRGKYGDMDRFVDKLKSKGYEKVELINTTDKFMKKREASLYFLNGSGILYGKK
ncbi:class I SAM-dependent methyltransferase [Methanobrevibacter sp. AbM4]|uniref:class I SAM-dependent methyltransferase n=1 Tax=Methanobrevibacter sp. AbM4 TaxID=224719 RepID=UPI0021012754|nr:class I SAM-dependent methyltransferase [Methanobrevibacter sp. AbM4]